MMAEYSLSRISASDRKLAALSMKENGKTFSEIGEAFGVSITRARQLVVEGVRIRQRHEEVRATEAEKNCPKLKVYEARVLLPLLDILKELPTLKVKKTKRARPVYVKFWI
jgi:hypothetical protein